MRVLADPDGGFDGQGTRVERQDLVIRLVAHVKLSRAGVDGNAREKGFLGFRARLGGSDEPRFASRVTEYVNLAGVAAGNEAQFAVATEGEAIPAFRQRQELGLFLGRDVEQRQAVFVETAMRGEQALSVRSDDEFESEIAHGHVLAGRGDTPAIEEEVLIGAQP